VRPSEKALMDANEAEHMAVAAAQFAQEALCDVTLCEIDDKLDKAEKVHSATYRNTLQHTATHCNTLQHHALHTAVRARRAM